MQTIEKKKPANELNGIDLDQMTETIGALQTQPSLAEFQFRSTGRWFTGGHNRSMVSGFYGAGQEHQRREPFVIDQGEPEVLLGKDTGANPVEVLLVALAGCTTTSLALHSAANGIEIESIETELEGDIDLNGFLGLDPEVKAGYEGIRIKYKIKSDADEATLRKFIGMSPVCDTICRPVPISIEIEKV
jgi:uncharacterized OsmC-like protein